MRADLIALLDLQAKDAALSEADSRLAALGQETSQLDEALLRARESLQTARHALAEGQPGTGEESEGSLDPDGRARFGALGDGERGE